MLSSQIKFYDDTKITMYLEEMFIGTIEILLLLEGSVIRVCTFYFSINNLSLSYQQPLHSFAISNVLLLRSHTWPYLTRYQSKIFVINGGTNMWFALILLESLHGELSILTARACSEMTTHLFCRVDPPLFDRSS